MEHKSQIRARSLDAPLVSHFLEVGHSPNDLRFFAFYKFQAHLHNLVDIPRILSILEASWIYILNTITHFGLNSALDWMVFL